MSELALQRIAKEKQERTGKLDLGGTGLTNIPEELFELTWLEELDFRNQVWDEENKKWIEKDDGYSPNKLVETAIPQSFSSLKQLKVLHLTSSDWDNKWQISDCRALAESIELHTLSLRHNQINNLNFLSQLKCLQHLDLIDNQIENIDILSEQVNLQFLNIGYNLIKDISPLSDLTKLRYLFLNRNQISDYSHLNRLTELESLKLTFNHIKDISFLSILINLKSLDLAHNQISDIYYLENLINLKSLFLDWNQISDISILSRLTDLQTLILGSNKISDFSPITNIMGLITLDLHNNNVNDIDFLKNHIDLTYLDLSDNNIENVNSLSNLTKLKILDLSSNKIKDINILEKLINLETLKLGWNQISDISILSFFTGIQILTINNNQICNTSYLSGLTNLISLDLGGNQLNDVLFLQKLLKLNFLDLRSNSIIEFNFIENLKNLETLNISENQINDIHFLLPVLKKGLNLTLEILGDKNIFMHGNPITTPPLNIVEKGTEAVLEWFAQEEKYGFEHYYEAKILVVGEPGAGKTSLVKKLEDENYPIPSKQKEVSTLGVEVLPLHIFNYSQNPEIQLCTNFWDFGGQDIQYALHQYFLSPQAVYILVADYRPEKTRFGEWFQIINLLGGKESKVIVLLNRFKDATSVGDFNIANYTRDFPELDVETISLDLAETGEDWRHFRAKLQEKIEALPIVGSQNISIWKTVRERMNASDKNSLSREAFDQLAIETGMEQHETSLMLDYFHKTGVVVHFPNDCALENEVYLQPNWITKAIYSALSKENVEHENGRFKKSWLFGFWQQRCYTHTECVKLLNLMRKDKFDICYPIENGGLEEEFIIPMLLPATQPTFLWDKTNNLHLRYTYPEYMPKGILSQFIVKLYQQICKHEGQQLVWKEGIVLQDETDETRAEVRQHSNGREIQVRLTGKYKKELRKTIMDAIGSIIRRFPRKPDIKIPCNCKVCEGLDEPYFFILEDLQKAIAHNKTIAGYCTKSFETIPISQVWDDFKDITYINAESQGQNFPIGQLMEQVKGIKELIKERNMDIHFHNNPHFENKPDIRVEGSKVDVKVDAKSESASHAEVTNTISISIQNMVGQTEMLKKDIEKEKKVLVKKGLDEDELDLVAADVDDATESLKALEEADKNKTDAPAEAKGRVEQFIGDLQNEDSTLRKTLKLLRRGKDYGVKIAKGFNLIAENFGFDKVPDDILDALKLI